MENLRLGLLLHFYQPWWQFPAVLQKITEQCYRPILKLVNEINGFCFTANINLSLLDLLEKDFPDVITGFREAIAAGKIELMSSPAQHPILPLIPEFLQRAQIEDDENRKSGQFGIKRNCQGFYLPEMAFSRNDIELFRSYGHWWSVIDDGLFMTQDVSGSPPFDRIITYNGFKMFMRSRFWSNLISFDHPSFNDLRSKMEHDIPPWTKNAPAYLTIAMDAETFGHHPGDLLERLLKPMLYEWAGSRISSLEDISQNFPTHRVPYIPDSSWSTSADDLVRSDPYPLWKSRFNIYHLKLWELVNMALEYFEHDRQSCLMMTSSCHWWWISRDHWNPDFMVRGAKKAIELIRAHASKDEADRAERIYRELRELH